MTLVENIEKTGHDVFSGFWHEHHSYTFNFVAMSPPKKLKTSRNLPLDVRKH